MPLRLVQISLPRWAKLGESGLPSEEDVIASWRDESSHENLIIHLLVPAEQAESIIEKIEKKYGSSSEFTVVLLPVQGVYPRIEQETQPSANNVATRNPLGQRVYREELYNNAIDSSKLTDNFFLLVVLSAIVAAVGLTQDNLPVIIGAMVIAPLLGPNMSLAVGTTLGDVTLIWRALRTSFLGILVTAVISLFVGMIMIVNPDNTAISRLTEVGLTDITIALAAGSAGAIAFTTGLPRAVIGVMVAVALLPPLCAFGLLLGAGYISLALNALLLTATNIICINLAAVTTFLVKGVRPTRWQDEEHSKYAIWIAFVLWGILLATLISILVTR